HNHPSRSQQRISSLDTYDSKFSGKRNGFTVDRDSSQQGSPSKVMKTSTSSTIFSNNGSGVTTIDGSVNNQNRHLSGHNSSIADNVVKPEKKKRGRRPGSTN